MILVFRNIKYNIRGGSNGEGASPSSTPKWYLSTWRHTSLCAAIVTLMAFQNQHLINAQNPINLNSFRIKSAQSSERRREQNYGRIALYRAHRAVVFAIAQLSCFGSLCKVRNKLLELVCRSDVWCQSGRVWFTLYLSGLCVWWCQWLWRYVRWTELWRSYYTWVSSVYSPSTFFPVKTFTVRQHYLTNG